MSDLNFQNFPVLTTSRLRLRQLGEFDAEEIFALRSNEEVNKYIDRNKQTDPAEAYAFIQMIHENIASNKSLYWAICLKDTKNLIGTICIWNFNSDKTAAEVGFEMLPKFQGLGLMSEALESVVHFCFLNLSLKKLLAFTDIQNLSSQRLLEKATFKLEVEAKDESNPNIIVFSLQATEVPSWDGKNNSI
jgi:ribosomal-protein-alanine N-acetyltransferase